MAIVKFTANLKRFYPDLKEIVVEGHKVCDVLDEIEERHKGIKDYIVDESGVLRKHVNIFIGNELIKDRNGLTDVAGENEEIYIMQALSGG